MGGGDLVSESDFHDGSVKSEKNRNPNSLLALAVLKRLFNFAEGLRTIAVTLVFRKFSLAILIPVFTRVHQKFAPR